MPPSFDTHSQADFYLQLYAIRQGVPPESAFYSVRPTSAYSLLSPSVHPRLLPSQLAILNASSVLGRLLPSFLADQLGVYNMLIPSLVASSVVLFGMLFVRNFTGVIVFGSLYGFTSGACAHLCSLLTKSRSDDASFLDISLIPPLLGQLTTEISELGCVFSRCLA